jgi:hypothetical protein
MKKISATINKYVMLNNLRYMSDQVNLKEVNVQKIEIHGGLMTQHKSGVNMKIGEIDFVINKGEKVLMLYDDFKLFEVFIKLLIMAYEHKKLPIYSIIGEDGSKTSPIGKNNLKNLVYLPITFNLKKQSIIDNFGEIIPNITTDEVEFLLNAAGCTKEVNSKFIYRNNLPKYIKYRIFIALILGLKKTLIVFDGDLLKYYNDENELKNILNLLGKHKSMIVMYLNINNFKESKLNFDSIYQFISGKLINISKI